MHMATGITKEIFPMVLTSATQEMFVCRADEDVTGDSPYKLLRKDDIVQDMKTRAAVSDFSPVKQIVLNYPEEEILLVFDKDFTYGQNFYLVLTPEAKERILIPVLPEAEKEVAVEGETSEVFVQKSPEPQPWTSLGSEQEIQDESVQESRERLRCKISMARREFGAPVCFTCRNAAEAKDGSAVCFPYQDHSFSIKLMERHCGVQAISKTQTSSTQTQWKYPKNMCTQCEPREFPDEERENILQSESLKNFINSVAPRIELALQQNEIMDVFFDDWKALGGDDSFEGKTDTLLREHQSFTDLRYSKGKAISDISWHPTITGVIAVAMIKTVSFEERFGGSSTFLHNSSLILFWSFSDPFNPQLLLECPDNVLTFAFCPSDPNIIVGGCMNGQVVLWDISAHAERLQESQPGGGKNTSVNNTDASDFEEKKKNETPVVRYCAVSAIESSHKAPITDVQWLPETFEVTKTGIPVENENNICVQIVTCALDCCLMIWDIRAPRMVTQLLMDSMQRMREEPLEKPHTVPSTFRHLNLTWKPLVRVSLPKMDTRGEYSATKFSLEANTCDSHTDSDADRAHQYVNSSEVNPEYDLLRVPSAKTLKPLEEINTKLYVGTEDGDLVYTDWRLEKDSDSGRLYSAKPSHCFSIHSGVVTTVQRSPFFKDIILTVGGWTFAIWREGVMAGPIMQSANSEKMCTVGYWSQSRPAVFFIGKADGNIEIWNLLEKTYEPSQVQNITTNKITHIKPCVVSPKQHFLAVSDEHGRTHILRVPWILHSPSGNEKLKMREYFDRGVERLVYFEKRREKRMEEKKNAEAEELRKKMEPIKTVKSMAETEEEDAKEYEDYLSLTEVILKGVGLLLDPEDNTLKN
ncbi:dynein axonemal intermediate chain 3 [Lampris incognitus]|uniref:dynein axonemal intermediate chain 3 n=1 Tax=Lampris incognitus TaxID=2546036 RepID=UPI0024B5F4E4|nr:dynein axonemal intermediate chain 3 [Lampris incognitus]